MGRRWALWYRRRRGPTSEGSNASAQDTLQDYNRHTSFRLGDGRCSPEGPANPQGGTRHGKRLDDAADAI